VTALVMLNDIFTGSGKTCCQSVNVCFREGLAYFSKPVAKYIFEHITTLCSLVEVQVLSQLPTENICCIMR